MVWDNFEMEWLWTPSRGILETDLISVEEVEKCFGIHYSKKQLAVLEKTRWNFPLKTKKDLGSVDIEYFVFPGFPLSIRDLFNQSPKLFGNFSKHLQFQERLAFLNARVELRWYTMSKMCLPNTFDKTFRKQQNIIPPGSVEKVPLACEACFALLLYLKARKTRLLKNQFARCSDEIIQPEDIGNNHQVCRPSIGGYDRDIKIYVQYEYATWDDTGILGSPMFLKE